MNPAENSPAEPALCPSCNVGRFTLYAAGEHFCDHCETGRYNAARTYLPNLYAILIPKMRDRARELGYALALHGSMVRDLDLIACPWTDEAAPAEQLAATLLDACGGYIIENRAARDPTSKPHGRLAWSIHLGGHAFIDLSVMPRKASE